MPTLTPPVNWAKLKKLSKSERIGLAQAILETVVAEDEVELSEEFKAELLRRSARAKSHPEALVPWEVVQKNIANRYAKKSRS